MKRFAELYSAIDRTTSTNAKVGAMVSYFRNVPAADGAWAVYILSGLKLARLVKSGHLAAWATEHAGIRPWLFDECYGTVGDLAETVALLVGKEDTEVPPGRSELGEIGLARWMEELIAPLKGLAPESQRHRVTEWWTKLRSDHVFLVNKFLTGELRVGVSRTLLIRAVAEASEQTVPTTAGKLAGTWEPTPEFFLWLTAQSPERPAPRRRGNDAPGLFDSVQSAAPSVSLAPYPFFLASPMGSAPQDLGPVAAWLLEWKWDGIRAQLVRRGADWALWSRGEELITERFPELQGPAMALPQGSVLDGEILAWGVGGPRAFQAVQTRIGRKRLNARVLAAAPAVFLAFDLLEHAGVDVRVRSLAERRELLTAMVPGCEGSIRLSPRLECTGWDEVAALRLRARDEGVEGIMIKRLASAYGLGRTRGDWWKWKIDPLTLDAVLVYAQPGHGKRAALLTDYTFALWDRGELVPVAKAYSGLTNDEIVSLDAWVRRNTLERFGPVRRVTPDRVFEIAFEAIGPSPRHRSGIAVRFPRILRERSDKPAADADTLDRAMELIRAQERRNQGR